MNTLVGRYVGQTSPEEMRERVLRYLPLVRHVVLRISIHLPSHVDLDDLESVGVMGLMEAVRRFDPNRGVTFKTFAYGHVRGAVLGELRSRDVVSRATRKKIRTLDQAEATLAGRLGRPPTMVELMQETGFDEEAIEAIRLARHTHSVLSLDGAEGAPSGSSLLSGLVAHGARDPQEIAARREEVRLLTDALTTLPEIDQKVLVLYYTKGLYQREIGKVLGVSESRVCQIHARAIRRLEQVMGERPGEARGG